MSSRSTKYYQKVKAQLSNPEKPLSVQITFNFPIFAMVLFGHFVIIIAICNGQKEATENTIEKIANFRLFLSQKFFYQLNKVGFEFCELFCPLILRCSMPFAAKLQLKQVDIYFESYNCKTLTTLLQAPTVRLPTNPTAT